jgi:hypothetical protein
MDMGMFNRLPCRLSAVHADIEASHQPVLHKDVGPELIEHKADGAPFWLE